MQNSKLLFLAVLFFSSMTCMAQKTSFGLTGGLLNGGERLKQNGSSASASDTGFYAGLFAKVPISEKVGLQPEIDYGNLNGSNFGFLSARVNYALLQNLYLQLGPELVHIFESFTPMYNRNGLNASFGLGYDVTDKFHVQARYSLEMTNRLKDSSIDATSKINWLHVGIGFAF